jgi:adenosylhomocysteine nucleosidase
VNLAATDKLGGPCATGIVFALPIEADAFERLPADRAEVRADDLTFHEGTIATARVAWCVGGVGRDRAARAARLLVDGHRPRALVSAGFAGGLDQALARGSVVRPTAVRGLAEGGLLRLAGAGEGDPIVVTLDRIVRTAMEKQSLAERTGASIVDMETLAVAEVARDAGLPCYALRVVSDAAGDELPPDLGSLCEMQSVARRAGAVLGMLGRRPRSAIDLWKLWERAVLDGRTLAAALEKLCRSLAASHGGRLTPPRR